MDTQLEEMRQQMLTLKKKLEKQEIVNDRLIRRSMKNTAGNIRRTYLMTIAVSILMVPYGYWAFVTLSHFSVAFWIGTSIFMLVCGGATLYNRRNLSDARLMTNNLIDVRRRMACAKKFDSDWLFFSTPAVWRTTPNRVAIQAEKGKSYQIEVQFSHIQTYNANLKINVAKELDIDYQKIISQIEDFTSEE